MVITIIYSLLLMLYGILIKEAICCFVKEIKHQKQIEEAVAKCFNDEKNSDK